MEGCALIERKHTSEATKVIDTVVTYIRDHLHLDLTVNHCAKQVHLSGSYFANLFKQVTGSTFNYFVTKERMERAKTMLLDDYPVQEISESLGYVERRYISATCSRNIRA
ncbi:HTH-type transcriptional regulator YesS [compost metagenome]